MVGWTLSEVKSQKTFIIWAIPFKEQKLSSCYMGIKNLLPLPGLPEKGSPNGSSRYGVLISVHQAITQQTLCLTPSWAELNNESLATFQDIQCNRVAQTCLLFKTVPLGKCSCILYHDTPQSLGKLIRPESRALTHPGTCGTEPQDKRDQSYSSFRSLESEGWDQKPEDERWCWELGNVAQAGVGWWVELR